MATEPAFAEQAVLMTVDQQGLAGWAARGELALQGCVSEQRIGFEEAPQLQQLIASRTPVMCDAGTHRELHALMTGRLGLEPKGRIALLMLSVDDRAMGCYALGRFREGRSFDPALVAELVVRLSWRMQALHLMDCVLAPIGSRD